MAVVIRLQRTGKPKQPYFRVVAIEKKRGPHGKPLEILGHYNPRIEKPSEKVVLQKERYEHWISVGAKPTDSVATLIKGRARKAVPKLSKKVQAKAKAAAQAKTEAKADAKKTEEKKG